MKQVATIFAPLAETSRSANVISLEEPDGRQRQRRRLHLGPRLPKVNRGSVVDGLAVHHAHVRAVDDRARRRLGVPVQVDSPGPGAERDVLADRVAELVQPAVGADDRRGADVVGERVGLVRRRRAARVGELEQLTREAHLARVREVDAVGSLEPAEGLRVGRVDDGLPLAAGERGDQPPQVVVVDVLHTGQAGDVLPAREDRGPVALHRGQTGAEEEVLAVREQVAQPADGDVRASVLVAHRAA
jgi:hypothetical protein